MLYLSIICLVTGCASSRILVSAEKYNFPLAHRKIMIVGAIKDNDDSLRLHVERRIAADLDQLGYNAISALDEFGHDGLSNLGQEATYLKLCSQGIDAVIVITIIDNSKDTQFRTQKSYAYPDNYYYDRIWNYRKIQADLSTTDRNGSHQYFWEAILFNLATLEAECTIQSPNFTTTNGSNSIPFEQLLVKKMLREKILKKQKTQDLKAF